ncbi:hypothetical protein TNIN_345621 [Trichonephila inaurata madagascariensis]|uniref:Uncharacterized protein n=1 Tax=Trichonephila inaurata madagascariensis TaxID=2747483 RepID=A0A8X6XRJ2_9ARAC|nr:hypothetical protein TNIN_345621 [Trichonephila inaurata madagascariensis]
MPGRFHEQSMSGSALSHWLTNPLNSEISEPSSHSWRCTPSLSIFSFKLQNLLSPLLPPPSSEDLRWFLLKVWRLGPFLSLSHHLPDKTTSRPNNVEELVSTVFERCDAPRILPGFKRQTQADFTPVCLKNMSYLPYQDCRIFCPEIL